MLKTQPSPKGKTIRMSTTMIEANRVLGVALDQVGALIMGNIEECGPEVYLQAVETYCNLLQRVEVETVLSRVLLKGATMRKPTSEA